ncbi:MAG: hypothetical protein DIZ80_12015 [endosymbiont of Galathealinum brachiosum]|uniref:DUF2860 domain-containing protein n=1 Tax=endosymbiont of Galathealinum brachiosum TaxID=2200906 RepID=A0A370DDJ2_9GAMM|nr:MAG: hypothetical protein DIZ80_12015 [endosymbiont of Galathealinum brachiosum]
MKKIILISFVLININNLAFADTDKAIRLDASLSYDDNLNRSPTDTTAIESAFATAVAGYNISYPMNTRNFIDYRLLAKYEGYQDTDGLNNAEISAGVTYHYKPVAGFLKAMYIFKGDIHVTDFETDIRDRTAYEASAMVSFWVTNTLSFRSGLTARKRDSDSRVFDTKDYRVFFNADLMLSRHSTLYTTLNFLTGDLVSTIPLDDSDNEVLDVVRQAEVIEFDPTFGDNMIAYKLDADIAALTLGYNYVLGKKQSLDLSARYAVGQSDYDVDYDALFFNISYLVSFRL